LDQFKLDGLSKAELQEGYKGLFGLLNRDGDPNSVQIPRHLENEDALKSTIQSLRAPLAGQQSFKALAENADADPTNDVDSPVAKIKKLAASKGPKSAGDQAYLKSMMILFGAKNQQSLSNSLNGIQSAASIEVPKEKVMVADADQNTARIEFNTKALGYENFEDFAIANQGPLQNEFGLYDNANIYNADGSYNVATQQKMLSHIAQNTDQSQLFKDALASDASAETISMAQSVVGAKITGMFNEETRDGMKQFLENQDGGIQGLRSHFHSDVAGDGNIPSTASITQAIQKGQLPIIKELLPENMQGLDEAALRSPPNAQLIATHLTDETNFNNYDAALKARDASADAELNTAIDAKTVLTSDTVLNSATGPIQGLPTSSRFSVVGTEEAAKTAETIQRRAEAGDIEGASAELNKHAVEGMDAVRTQQIGYVGKNLETFAEIDSFKGLTADQIVDKFNAEGLKRGSPLEQEILSKDTRIHDKIYGSGEFGSYRKQFMNFEKQQQTAENNFQAPAQTNSSSGFVAGIKSFFGVSSAAAAPPSDNQNITNPAQRAAVTGADNNNNTPALGMGASGGGW